MVKRSRVSAEKPVPKWVCAEKPDRVSAGKPNPVSEEKPDPVFLRKPDPDYAPKAIHRKENFTF